MNILTFGNQDLISQLSLFLSVKDIKILMSLNKSINKILSDKNVLICKLILSSHDINDKSYYLKLLPTWKNERRTCIRGHVDKYHVINLASIIVSFSTLCIKFNYSIVNKPEFLEQIAFTFITNVDSIEDIQSLKYQDDVGADFILNCKKLDYLETSLFSGERYEDLYPRGPKYLIENMKHTDKFYFLIENKSNLTKIYIFINNCLVVAFKTKDSKFGLFYSSMNNKDSPFEIPNKAECCLVDPKPFVRLVHRLENYLSMN